METGVFAPAKFVIDALDGSFDGYTDGSTWNGWACPYFEKSVAEQVLKASEANGYNWNYDGERDVFSVRSEQDPEDYEPEEFAGLDMTVEDRSIRAYAIGAYSWIWEMTDQV